LSGRTYGENKFIREGGNAIASGIMEMSPIGDARDVATAIEDPSLTNIGVAGLAMLPVVGKGLKKVAKGVKAVDSAKNLQKLDNAIIKNNPEMEKVFKEKFVSYPSATLPYEKVEDTLVSIFGKPKDLGSTGFILSDGRGIDLKRKMEFAEGGALRGEPGWRNHGYALEDVYKRLGIEGNYVQDLKKVSDEVWNEHSGRLNGFLSESGAIRVHPQGDEINFEFHKQPTLMQYSYMRQMAKDFDRVNIQTPNSYTSSDFPGEAFSKIMSRSEFSSAKR